MNYMGSKRKIAPYIAGYINNIAMLEGIENYYEPFVGGANMITAVNIKNRYGSDLNKYMIALFHKMQSNETLEFVDVDHDKYLDIKNNKDKYDDWFVGYSSIVHTFMVSGAFNSYEKNEKQKIWNHNGIVKDIPKIKDINFQHCSYEQLEIKDKSIVYCDAPYINTKGYITGTFDFNKYYDWLTEVAKNNLVFISEYTMPDDRFICIDTFKIENQLSRQNNKKNRLLNKTTKLTENLYIVKGGYLTDKYFSNDIGYDF